MSLFEDVLSGVVDFGKIMDEADRLEQEHYLAKGWKKDALGNWMLPDGRPAAGNVFDGPGSHVSTAAFAAQAARNLGINVDKLSGTAARLRQWLEGLRR